MNKDAIITSLQTGIEGAIEVIDYFYQRDLLSGGVGDPQVFYALENLRQILKYSVELNEQRFSQNSSSNLN